MACVCEVGTSVVTLTIFFPFPTEHVTSNDRRSWKALLKPKKEWRDAAHWHAAAQTRGLKGKPLDNVNVQITYTGIMVRDAHNLSVTSKWILDGIVAAGVLVDDSDDHITLLPTRVVRHRWPIHRRTVTVTITDRTQQEG